MSEEQTTATKQLLDQFRDGIRELENMPDQIMRDADCVLGGPMKRAVVLMMRYHKFQLAESVERRAFGRKFCAAARVAIIAAFTAAVLNPSVWGIARKLFGSPK